MNNIQLMGIIQQYKYGKATDQDVENAVKEFEADVKQQNDG
jgi:3-dehydroquinate dehydratase